MTLPAGLSASAAVPSCVDSADGLAAAVRAARLCGRVVEDASLRSATTQVFARADGTLSARMSSGPVRVRQGGGWVEVDLTLVRRADGSVGSRVHPFGLWLSGAAGAGVHELVMTGAGVSRVGYGWVGPLPEPVLSGTTARYREVRPGIDLVVEANRSGFEQFLVVKDRTAAASVSSISFPVRGGGRRLAVDGRRVSWRDPVSGVVAVESPEPVMWDAAVGSGSGERSVAEVGVSVAKRSGGPGGWDADVVLAPDAVFLADPARQFPITIDPGIHHSVVGAPFDTWVQNSFQNTDNQGSVDLKLGHATDSQGSYVARSYLRWPMNASGLSLSGARIYSAKLSLWNYHSWSCVQAKWYASLTGPVGSGTRWNVEPTWYAGTQAESVETKGYSGCGGGYVAIFPTAAIQQAANWGWAEATIGLKGGNDGDVLTWKRFNSSNAASNIPVLEIDFDHYPGIPAGQAVEGSTGCGVGDGVRQYLATTMPLVTARLDDVNSGQNLVGELELTQGTTVVYAGKVAEQPVAPGQVARWSGLTLTPGLVYTYRLRGYDGTERGGWTPPCELQVDIDRPDNPPIVEVGVSAGGVTPVTFRPDPDDIAEVAGYVYGDAPERLSSMVSAGPDGSATVPITATADITVYVKAVNRGRLPSLDATAAVDLFGSPLPSTHVGEDFNGDGLADVIGMVDVGGGRSQLYEMTKGGPGPSYAPVILQSDTSYETAKTQQVSGDFNGDGRADVALFKDAGAGASMMSALRSTGNGVVDTAVWGPQAGWSFAASKLVVGNFDGDVNARDDIAVVYNDGGNNFRLRVFVSTGTAGVISFALPATWFTNCAGCADWTRMSTLAGDFNGDGRADFGHFYDYGSCHTKLWVHLSTGSGFGVGAEKWDGGVNNVCADRATYVVGRFTNDSRADIAVVYRYEFCDTGVWLWAPDAAGNIPAVGQWFRSGVASWCAELAQPHVGDTNGDGLSDLSLVYRCCGPYQAKWWRLVSTGTAYAAPELTWEGSVGATGVGALAIDETKRYQLVATHSGLCLQVPGGGTADNIQLRQDVCNPANLAGSFKLVHQGAGQVQLRPAHTSGKCVDIVGPTGADGAALHQWSCYAGLNQWWQPQYISGVGDVVIQLVSVYSGKCFDIEGISAAPGARLIQFGCWGGANQRFVLRPVP